MSEFILACSSVIQSRYFLQRMACEADADKSSTGGLRLENQMSSSNPPIAVERNNLRPGFSILSLWWNFSRATWVSVNLPLVWVCVLGAGGPLAALNHLVRDAPWELWGLFMWQVMDSGTFSVYRVRRAGFTAGISSKESVERLS